MLQSIAWIGRFYPFYSGNFSLVNSTRLYRYGRRSELAWCPSPGGPILIPLNDDVGRCIYLTGDYDRKITWLCRRILRQGDTALDLGAIGVVTLAMAKFVGSKRDRLQLRAEPEHAGPAPAVNTAYAQERHAAQGRPRVQR
jgi:hypothetical protein